MNLTKNTIAILKNFAGINANLLITPGSELKTRDVGRSMFARATVEEVFPQEFGIYNLSEFLGIASVFEAPELEFSEKFVTVKEGKRKAKYHAAPPEILTTTKGVKPIQEVNLSFEFPATMLDAIKKSSSILAAPDFSIIGDGKMLTVKVSNKKNVTSNTYSQEVGETDKVFRANLKVEYLKFIAGDYECAICDKRVAQFTAKNADISYVVAVEEDSEFDF